MREEVGRWRGKEGGGGEVGRWRGGKVGWEESSPHISEELSGPSLLSELMSSSMTSQSFLRGRWREGGSGACSIGSLSSAGETLDSEEGGVAGVTLQLLLDQQCCSAC